MKKKAIAVFEVKEGYNWDWGRNERFYYKVEVKKLKGKYRFEKVREIRKSGAGFEGVGGANYTIWKIKIYKGFVGSIIQTVEYVYSGYEEEEIIFDNIEEEKEKMLKKYLKAIETAKKINREINSQLVIYFDSELFTMRDFLEFVEKLKEKYEVYPLDVEKEYEELGFDAKVWRYKIHCENKFIILKYYNSYHGKEAYKKVDEILKEYEALLRKKID
jgi:hypothetical protein